MKELQMTWPQIGAVVATGLLVVFLAIIILIVIIWLMGKVVPIITDFISKSKAEIMAKKKSKTEIVQDKSTTSMPVKTAPKTEPKPIPAIAQSDDDDDIIAVISAAVAMMSLKDGKNYKVKSVKAINGTTSNRRAWAMAGLRENTRPFRQR